MDAPPTLLVVDDDVDICRNYADILGDFGYRVDVAHAGPAALELVAQRSYDLALLDLKMAGMDGLTLYREIRKRRSETAAIIVTGFVTSAVAEEALAAGVKQVLPKPADLPVLVELIAETLRHSSSD